MVVKGYTRKLDMFACLQPNMSPRFGFLSLSWAIVSDVDIQSEVLRCCGYMHAWIVDTRIPWPCRYQMLDCNVHACSYIGLLVS